MALVDFGHDICSNLEESSHREWLVTNGTGGYAAGTISGILTRSYHGYLVAALQPPVGRVLLLAKLDETIRLQGHSYPLYANRWASGVVEPEGFAYLERFYLEGSTPVWIYALEGIRLEKRLWMEQGKNTTWVRYKYLYPNSGLERPQDRSYLEGPGELSQSSCSHALRRWKETASPRDSRAASA